jgi:Holliday junction resolvase RusA-like endonuclease
MRIMEHQNLMDKFRREVEAYCSTRPFSHSTFTNRVLGKTQGLRLMQAAAEKLDAKIAKLRAAMGTTPAAPRLSNMARRGSVSLMLPVPPSTNSLTANGRSGRRYKTDPYQAWIAEAGALVMQARAGWGFSGLDLTRPYVARIRLSPEDRADTNNRDKALIDLLVKMQITPDDAHLRQITVGRSPAVPLGKVHITIRSWG